MVETLPDLPRYIRKRGDDWEGAPCKYGPWRPIPAPQSRLPWPHTSSQKSMTTHTLYDGPAGTGRLMVTASPGKSRLDYPAWLVQFTRYGKRGKQLDQCAAWLPSAGCWDEARWSPNGSTRVPLAVLVAVEAWLQGRPVASIESTTTETP